MEEIKDLAEEVKKLKKENISLKISIAYDGFNNTSQIRKNRRQIARLLTKINYLKTQQN